jgi:hypothetical protein
MHSHSSRILAAAVVALSAIYGCPAPDSTPPASSTSQAASPPAEVSGDAVSSFVNRVWAVAESQEIATGELRVFLSDGTLVMASSHATPAFGKWRYQEGKLIITEESLDYQVEILELNEDAFRIRILSPGEPIEILFVPAEKQPMSGK